MHEQGAMWSRLVSIYMYSYDPKKNLNDTLAVDSPFQTLAVDVSSNIYRLALPLCTPEMLSSLSKSRITVINVHLTIFVQRMTQLWSHNPVGKYRHLVNYLGTVIGSKSTTVAFGKPHNKQNCCRTGEECQVSSST